MTNEVTMRAPRNIFWHLEGGHFGGALFDDEIVDVDEAGGGETEFGEHQVDAVHPEGEFVPQFGEVGVLEGRAVADDEGALACVLVLERGEATDALAPPRMEVGGGNLRQAAEGVIGVLRGLEEGGGDSGLFHDGFVCNYLHVKILAFSKMALSPTLFTAKFNHQTSCFPKFS